MAGWVKIDDFVKEIRDEPWSLYWREWKSGTKEFEDFLHNPLSVVSAEITEVTGKGWSVSTDILNHELSLMISAVCTLLIVQPDEKRLKLSLFKHKPE